MFVPSTSRELNKSIAEYSISFLEYLLAWTTLVASENVPPLLPSSLLMEEKPVEDKVEKDKTALVGDAEESSSKESSLERTPVYLTQKGLEF